MNHIKSFLFIMMAMVSLSVSASKAVHFMRQVTLESGREVTVHPVGDEYLHYLVTTEGEVVVEENGRYRLATMLEVENLKIQSQQYSATLRARMQGLGIGSPLTAEGIYTPKPFPHMGRPRALVIMVAYSDIDFIYTKAEIDSVFNAREYNADDDFKSYGSMAQYFDDCSQGNFRPQFDLVGPYTLDNEQQVYGGVTDRVDSLVIHACRKAEADGVDFSKYDTDGDGYLDLVYVLYSGYGASMGADEYVWPCSGWLIPSKDNVFGGKHLFRYSVSPELFGDPYVEKVLQIDSPKLNGIGVAVHEFSHVLGLPDIYPTLQWLTEDNYYDVLKYDNQSMEDWDVMDNGENINNGFDPVPYTAWEMELMGWTEKMDTLKERCEVSLTPIIYGGSGKRIMNDNDPTGNEYWILENVPAGNDAGWYRAMPGSGMLVTHINYDKNEFRYAPNNVPGAPRMTLIPADGELLSSYRSSLSRTDPKYMSVAQIRANMKCDSYPLVTEDTLVTSLTDYRAYTGTVDKPITAITKQADGTITFKFMGGNLIMGDVNMDGSVTVADANVVVNRFLGNTTGDFDTEAADLNDDGEITIGDANAIVNMYLEK